MESGCSCSIGGIKDRVHLNLRKKQIFLSGGRWIGKALGCYTFTKGCAIPSPNSGRHHDDGIRYRKKKLRNCSFQNCPPFGFILIFWKVAEKSCHFFDQCEIYVYKLWALPKQCWDHFHKMGWTSKVSKPPTSTHLNFDIFYLKKKTCFFSQKGSSNLPSIIFAGANCLLNFGGGKNSINSSKFRLGFQNLWSASQPSLPGGVWAENRGVGVCGWHFF